eukprot:2164-Heterococcus_DN1.PRE.1
MALPWQINIFARKQFAARNRAHIIDNKHVSLSRVPVLDNDQKGSALHAALAMQAREIDSP